MNIVNLGRAMIIRMLSGLVLALCLMAPLAGADPLPCPDPRFSTETPDTSLHHRVCAIASDSAARMRACGLTTARPLLIEIVDRVEHPFADCLAAFDCDLDRIRVTDPERFADLLPPTATYASLPPEVLLRALLTHELAHAMVEHATPGIAVPPVDHEYIAAAMELDGLPPVWRAHLLDRAGLETPHLGLIDIWIYRLEPRRFAANALLHFAQPANGCALIGRIVAGEFSFATNPAR
jgi:hypothetical protein